MSNEVDYLENIIALLPGHIYWKNKQGVFLGCNNEQAKFIGLQSPKEVKGLTAFDTLPADFAEKILKTDLEVMRNGIPQTIEEVLILQDGQESIWLSKKVPLKNSTGEVIGILGISFDITEQKKIEKELIETKTRLEGMTLLSASIAHELRTPFANLNITLKTLENKIKSLTTTNELSLDNANHFSTDLGSIKKEIKAALTFIDMLLLNINPTINEAKITHFSIKECINHSLERYPFVGKQHELISWHPDKNPDFTVHGEELLVIHLLFNLIKNALYYIAKARKGNIEIWIENLTVFFKDTGTGIKPDHLPHIFKHFFSQTYHGAGIGLTFCQWVMDNLHGKITCESEEGHYTLFTLDFPNNT